MGMLGLFACNLGYLMDWRVIRRCCDVTKKRVSAGLEKGGVP